MFWTLIAVFAAGFAGAGLAMALRFTFKSTSRALVPIFAGGAMLLATVSTEYTWYGNQVAQLPNGFEVTLTQERTAWWQPWTYAVPYTTAFLAIDRAGALVHEELPDVEIVTLYNFARWTPPTAAPLAVNCTGALLLSLADQSDLSADALRDHGAWVPIPVDDPIGTALCTPGSQS